MILIDGGKPQLSATQKELQTAKIKLPIVGIAKGKDRKKNQFFVNDKSIEKWVKENKNLLIQVRDEAHRFAITFHRERRSKRTFKTELTDIKGIGNNATEKLLTHFKSVNEIKKQSEEEISKVVGQAKAKLIVDYFK